MDRAARLTTRSTATLTQRNVARRRMGRPNMRKRFTDNARAALPLTCHCGDVATHTTIWGATCDEHTFHGHDDSRVRLAPRLLGLGFLSQEVVGKQFGELINEHLFVETLGQGKFVRMISSRRQTDR